MAAVLALLAPLAPCGRQWQWQCNRRATAVGSHLLALAPWLSSPSQATARKVSECGVALFGNAQNNTSMLSAVGVVLAAGCCEGAPGPLPLIAPHLASGFRECKGATLLDDGMHGVIVRARARVRLGRHAADA